MQLLLVYHRVAPPGAADLYRVPAETLRKHLSLVAESGLPIVNPRCWSAHDRGVVFTFDDGTVDHFDTARPILQQFGVTGLFYVPTAKLGSEGHMTADQVGRLFTEGHTIGSHGHTHTRLDALTPSMVRSEMEMSGEAIQRITGQHPLHFAPPGGFYNDAVQRIAVELGYRFFRTMRWGYNRRFKAMRLEVVPITGRWGDAFLISALRGKREWLLRTTHLSKAAIQCVLSPDAYDQLRGLVRATAARHPA